MKNPTMLYKHPGQHEIHGDKFDYTIVDADEEGAIEAAQAEGWHLTTTEAKSAEAKVPGDDEPPTRGELEAKAKELGVKFNTKTTDDELGKLIARKLES